MPPSARPLPRLTSTAPSTSMADVDGAAIPGAYFTGGKSTDHVRAGDPPTAVTRNAGEAHREPSCGYSAPESWLLPRGLYCRRTRAANMASPNALLG